MPHVILLFSLYLLRLRRPDVLNLTGTDDAVQRKRRPENVKEKFVFKVFKFSGFQVLKLSVQTPPRSLNATQRPLELHLNPVRVGFKWDSCGV